MTTKFLDNKICSFKILLSWRSPRKTAFLDDFSSLPPNPHPLKKGNFYFYCRLAFSEWRTHGRSRIGSHNCHITSPLTKAKFASFLAQVGKDRHMAPGSRMACTPPSGRMHMEPFVLLAFFPLFYSRSC